jgi:hypothetical protein
LFETDVRKAPSGCFRLSALEHTGHRIGVRYRCDFSCVS